MMGVEVCRVFCLLQFRLFLLKSRTVVEKLECRLATTHPVCVSVCGMKRVSFCVFWANHTEIWGKEREGGITCGLFT